MNFEIKVTNVQELLRLARFLDEQCPDASLMELRRNIHTGESFLSEALVVFTNVQNKNDQVVIQL